MRLAQWLAETRTPQQALADAVGVTQGRISQLAQGTGGTPSLALAAKIEAATGGQVPISGWAPKVETEPMFGATA